MTTDLRKHLEDTAAIDEAIECIEAHADIVANNDEISREEWLELRKSGLGGSDAATALGLNPWNSPYALWAEKTNEFDNEFDNEAMEMGRLLEPTIGQLFGSRTGMEVATYPRMLRSKEWPFATVNLDFIAPLAAVECKNVGLRQSDAWADGAIPDHYSLQGQWECAVTGLPKVYFAVLVGGQEFRIIEVDRNDALIADMMIGAEKFWHLVQDGTPPAVDGSEATTSLLRAMYPTPDPGSFVELPPTTLELVKRRTYAREDLKLVQENLDEIDNTLKAMLGDHEIGTVNGTPVVTWKRQERKGYEVKPTSFRKLGFPKGA